MSSNKAIAIDQFPPVRACIFDVDGLLIDSEDIYTEVYNNILRGYGKSDLPWSVKAKQQSRGRAGTLHLLEWAQLPITLDEWTTKVDSQREVFRKSRPLPGVPELLANLAWKTATPVRIALASSASRPNFAIKTSQIPFVSEAFPEHHRVFGSDEAMQGQNKKPAPDIFLLALHQVNGELTEGERKILPQECLVFEDSIAGVEAGRRAGMRVVWVPHEGLREVYKGHEDRVLEGKTEESGHQVGAINMEIGAKGNQGPLRSHDGHAQMLTSLEDFPYCDYGIHLK